MMEAAMLVTERVVNNLRNKSKPIFLPSQRRCKVINKDDGNMIIPNIRFNNFIL